MTLQIINNAFSDDGYSVYVDSRKAENAECIELENEKFPVHIEIAENNLLNGTRVTLGLILKILGSVFLHGGDNYYCPYRRVIQCTVVPEECPVLILEKSGNDLLFKNRDGYTVPSKSRVEISKKNFILGILLTVVRIAFVCIAAAFALYMNDKDRYLYSSLWYYSGIAVFILMFVCVMWDCLSTLIRSIKYFKNREE